MMTEPSPAPSILQGLPGVVFQYKFEKGKITLLFASRSITHLLAMDPREAALPTLGAICKKIHPEDVKGLRATLRYAAKNLTLWQRDFRVLLPDGHVKWVEAEAVPGSTEVGDVVWNGYAREVSERKMLEKDLRTAEEDLMKLVEERTERLVEANARLWALNQKVETEIAERIKLERHLRNSHELLSLLATDLVLSEERERRRIAMELHDDVVQRLALGKVRLEMSLQDGVPSTAILNELVPLIVEAVGQIRRICSDLSPPVLYDLGLAKAVQSLGERLAREHNFHFKMVTELADMKFLENMRTLLYQTARELLINAVKHARAGNVTVYLLKTLDGVVLRVTDDGVGFGTATKGFGLSHVQQRMQFLKGTLSIVSRPGLSVIEASVPFPVAVSR